MITGTNLGELLDQIPSISVPSRLRLWLKLTAHATGQAGPGSFRSAGTLALRSGVRRSIGAWNKTSPAACIFLGGNHYLYAVYLDYDERPHLLVGYPSTGPATAPPSSLCYS